MDFAFLEDAWSSAWGGDDEPNESLWIRLKKQSSMGDIVVSVCYRLTGQDELVHKVFYRQLKVASCL